MTLSGKGDSARRRERAKEYRRDIDERRNWLLPVLLGAAIVVVAGVVVYTILTGGGS
ncbi:hypothetical protein [Protaetiibacter intestinalis]|uniref:hypothetical protein n=1 Tax=Protaetiibacter intestinalis TaxID=2419774 RepID=UPI0013004A9F|nr:hypothetical protein [Protaetiibacter intestinalis]